MVVDRRFPGPARRNKTQGVTGSCPSWNDIPLRLVDFGFPHPSLRTRPSLPLDTAVFGAAARNGRRQGGAGFSSSRL